MAVALPNFEFVESYNLSIFTSFSNINPKPTKPNLTAWSSLSQYEMKARIGPRVSQIVCIKGNKFSKKKRQVLNQFQGWADTVASSPAKLEIAK